MGGREVRWDVPWRRDSYRVDMLKTSPYQKRSAPPDREPDNHYGSCENGIHLDCHPSGHGHVGGGARVRSQNERRFPAAQVSHSSKVQCWFPMVAHVRWL